MNWKKTLLSTAVILLPMLSQARIHTAFEYWIATNGNTDELPYRASDEGQDYWFSRGPGSNDRVACLEKASVLVKQVFKDSEAKSKLKKMHVKKVWIKVSNKLPDAPGAEVQSKDQNNQDDGIISIYGITNGCVLPTIADIMPAIDSAKFETDANIAREHAVEQTLDSTP